MSISLLADAEADLDKLVGVANAITPIEFPVTSVRSLPNALTGICTVNAEVFSARSASTTQLLIAEMRSIVGGLDCNHAFATAFAAILFELPSIASRQVLFNREMSAAVEIQLEAFVCQPPQRC